MDCTFFRFENNSATHTRQTKNTRTHFTLISKYFWSINKWKRSENIYGQNTLEKKHNEILVGIVRVDQELFRCLIERKKHHRRNALCFEHRMEVHNNNENSFDGVYHQSK